MSIDTWARNQRKRTKQDIEHDHLVAAADKAVNDLRSAQAEVRRLRSVAELDLIRVIDSGGNPQSAGRAAEILKDI